MKKLRISWILSKFSASILNCGKSLFLTLQPSGTCTFTFRQKVKGKDLSIKLGHFPNISLDEAREAVKREENITNVKASQADFKELINKLKKERSQGESNNKKQQTPHTKCR